MATNQRNVKITIQADDKATPKIKNVTRGLSDLDKKQDAATASTQKNTAAQNAFNKSAVASTFSIKNYTRQLIGMAAGYIGISTVIRAATDSMKLFTEHGKQMAFVNTIARKGTGDIDKMSKQIRKLRVDYGILGTAAEQALYNIYSNVGETGKNMEILEASAKASVAGMVDIDVAASAVTGAMNSMGLGVKDVNKILDVQFKTIEVGSVVYAQLAKNQGYFLSVAGGASQTIENSLGTYAALTKTLGSAERAATSLAQVYNRFTQTDFIKAMKAAYSLLEKRRKAKMEVEKRKDERIL